MPSGIHSAVKSDLSIRDQLRAPHVAVYNYISGSLHHRSVFHVALYMDTAVKIYIAGCKRDIPDLEMLYYIQDIAIKLYHAVYGRRIGMLVL